jgi:hypothetical protein
MLPMLKPKEKHHEQDLVHHWRIAGLRSSRCPSGARAGRECRCHRRARCAGRAVDLNHAQPGDPERLADVLVAFADAPNPPVRLPLGSDTVAAIDAKRAADAEILAQLRAVSISTDFAHPAAA